jgi:hypothetical protein
MRQFIFFFILLSLVSLYSFELEGIPENWDLKDFIGFDEIGDCAYSTGDIASVFLKQSENHLFLRITFDDMSEQISRQQYKDNFSEKLYLSFRLEDEKNNFHNIANIPIFQLSAKTDSYELLRTPNRNLLEISFPFQMELRESMKAEISIFHQDKIIDEYSSLCSRNERGGNCAFVHHGNQGLTYTEVFYGQYPNETSGFDEVLKEHEEFNIPGNFHMSGTLMPAAAWHNPEFNNWLSSGVEEGYVSMLTSALGQHIMPFVQNEMNNWSVSIENDMVEHFYDYVPKVAWVPERVWLAPGHYPDAGVIDWLGDNWAQHGVEAVILDDAPHCDTASNLKIHWMNNGMGINLRVIPIHNEFVGNMHYDAGAAKNLISNTGQYGIAVYGTDWEVAAEMNEHNGEWFLENYQDVMEYCYNNYPAVNVWKLDAALNNPDFNGQGIEVTPGTYFLLGGYEGYGYGNNSWYLNWASHPSHSDFHNPPWTYGYIWNNAYENLMSCPNNSLAQLGWYTLMINLHETGWHDSGEISGWEHRYSSHMKNANVYAEASRWANGDYTQPISAYLSDIDRNGVDEVVMYNENTFFVFKTIGGRAVWVFCKDDFGNMYSVVGSDVAYWSETDGDYNESSNNHFGALSEVSPNYQHEIYDVEIVENSGNRLEVQFTKNEVTKTCILEPSHKYLEVIFSSESGMLYNKSGFSPDLLDLIWHGKSNLQRMWGDFGAYNGRRNASSGATVAYVLGEGGAQHSGDFEGTLVMGDEISGNGTFKIFLYAGYTSEPYDEYNNKVVELDELAVILGDDIHPTIVNSAAYKSHENALQIIFDEPVTETSAISPNNYDLSNMDGVYQIQSILFTHNRKVTLFLESNLLENESGEILVSNVQDLAGNTILPNSSANVTTIIKPHVVGTMNDWDAADMSYEFSLQPNGLWQTSINLAPGIHEYKILETDTWSDNYPSENQILELTSAQTVTFITNPGVLPEITSGDEFVFHSENPPVLVGDFISALGGANWNVETTLTQMNDDGINGDILGNDGIYTRTLSIPAGNYEYKVVLNNNWTQNTSGGNLPLQLSANSEVTFYYDMAQNGIWISLQTSQTNEVINAVQNLSVGGVYPNPFNPSAKINFSLQHSSFLEIGVYNIKGQLVQTILREKMSAGQHEIVWNGTNNNGNKAASGVYLLRFKTPSQQESKKILLLK